jgi:uncharacterized Zn-binding protein involved in type VI secretion
MPQISRNNDLCVTGHTCTKKIGIIATANSVFVNGFEPIARTGDPCQPHNILKGLRCGPHIGAVINVGSSTVFAQGVPVARVGDSTDMGAMIQGSPDVFAGG